MKKRLLVTVLTVALALGMFPGQVFANAKIVIKGGATTLHVGMTVTLELTNTDSSAGPDGWSATAEDLAYIELSNKESKSVDVKVTAVPPKGYVSVNARTTPADELVTIDIPVKSCHDDNKFDLHEAHEAKCETDGNIAYYECQVCKKIYKDEGLTPTTSEEVTINHLGHKYSDTFESDSDSHWQLCVRPGCGKSTEKLPHDKGNPVIVKEVQPTATEPGYIETVTYCVVCGREMNRIHRTIPNGTYIVYDGAESTYNEETGGTVTFCISGPLDKFVSLKEKNKKVDEKNYTKASGSTVITLHEDYLKSLSAGKHTYTFVYTDGEVSADLTVEKKAKPKRHYDNDDDDSSYDTTPATTTAVATTAASTIQKAAPKTGE